MPSCCKSVVKFIFIMLVAGTWLVACTPGGSTSGPRSSSPASIQVNPSNILLTEQNETKVLTIKVYNDKGEELDGTNLTFEWLNNNSNTVSVVPDPDNSFSAAVTSKKALGSAILSVKLKDNPDIVSNPASVTIAQVKSNVQLLTDESIVFPPPFDTVPAGNSLPHISLVGEGHVGGFAASEVASYFEITPEGLFRFPVVLINTTVEKDDFIVSSEDAGIMGRVLSVKEQDGFSLLYVEETEFSEVYKEFVFDFDSEALLDQGIVTNESLFGKETTRKIQELLSQSFFDKCEVEGGFTLDNITLAKLPVRHRLIMAASIDSRTNRFKFVIGMQALVEVGPGINIQSGIKGKLECSLGEGIDFETHFPGPLRAALTGKLILEPKFIATADFSAGPAVTGSANISFELFAIAGYDSNASPSNISDAWIKPRWKTSGSTPDISQIDNLTFKLTAGVFGTAKTGIRLGGQPVSATQRLAEALPEILKGAINKVEGALLVDFLKGEIGPRASIVWDSGKRVIDNEKTSSNIILEGVGTLKLNSDGINKVRKKFGFSKLSFKLLEVTMPLARIYRPLTKSNIVAQSSLFNGVVSNLPIPVKQGEDVEFTIRLNYSSPELTLFPDQPLLYGEVWLAKERRILDITTVDAVNREMFISIPITQEICREGHLEFLAYNEILWIIDAAGYAGKVKLECQEDVAEETATLEFEDVAYKAINISDEGWKKVSGDLTKVPSEDSTLTISIAIGCETSEGFDLIINQWQAGDLGSENVFRCNSETNNKELREADFEVLQPGLETQDVGLTITGFSGMGIVAVGRQFAIFDEANNSVSLPLTSTSATVDFQVSLATGAPYQFNQQFKGSIPSTGSSTIDLSNITSTALSTFTYTIDATNADLGSGQALTQVELLDNGTYGVQALWQVPASGPFPFYSPTSLSSQRLVFNTQSVTAAGLTQTYQSYFPAGSIPDNPTIPFAPCSELDTSGSVLSVNSLPPDSQMVAVRFSDGGNVHQETFSVSALTQADNKLSITQPGDLPDLPLEALFTPTTASAGNFVSPHGFGALFRFFNDGAVPDSEFNLGACQQSISEGFFP